MKQKNYFSQKKVHKKKYVCVNIYMNAGAMFILLCQTSYACLSHSLTFLKGINKNMFVQKHV